VRRLPVVDAANRVIGLLSLADAVQHACEMAVAKRQREADEILTALLSITEPRRQGDGLSIQPADRQRAVALPPRARDGASPRIEESARPR
jgi:predicted nucleic acid-binding Zn ribbon protein